MVQKVVRESGTNLSFPMLTRTNYNDWALMMEVNLQAASLRDTSEDDTVSRKEDREAMAALIPSTPLENHNMLAEKMIAKEVFRCKTQRLGGDRARLTSSGCGWSSNPSLSGTATGSTTLL